MPEKSSGFTRQASRVLALSVALVAAAAVATGASGSPGAGAAATCSDYKTQAEAQRAADTRDPDRDGRFCVISPR